MCYAQDRASGILMVCTFSRTHGRKPMQAPVGHQNSIASAANDLHARRPAANGTLPKGAFTFRNVKVTSAWWSRSR